MSNRLYYLGLDPAKPYFDLVSEERRMLPTDAEFVDVIHTNSGRHQIQIFPLLSCNSTWKKIVPRREYFFGVQNLLTLNNSFRRRKKDGSS